MTQCACQWGRRGEYSSVYPPETDIMHSGRYPSKVGVSDRDRLQAHLVVVSRPRSVKPIDFAAPPTREYHVISEYEGTNMQS